MGKLREVEGTYGSGRTPSTIFVYDNSDGSHWYVAEGGSMVNKTYDDIEDGVHIEELNDDDVYTMLKPIKSLSDLEASIDDEEYAKGGKVTSKDLLDRLKAGDKITENEVNLIKNRMNNKREDEHSKELIQWIWDNQPELTPEQNKKGVDFLKNLWKSPTGKVRSSNPFGHREEQALETFQHFTLDGFHDISRFSGREFFVPIYGVYGSDGNFQYYYDSEGVHIIGAKGGKMGKDGKNKTGTPKEVKKRLEYLRKEIQKERISYGEIAELQSLAKYIEPDDVELLQWAGVEEKRSGGKMAKGGDAGSGNDVKDLFGKLKSYLDSTYQQIGNPQLAIEKFMTEQSASMDAGAKSLFEKLGMDLGTTYSTIEVPSMAVDKWTIENKVELGKGGKASPINKTSNAMKDFTCHYEDDGALIFGGSYFNNPAIQKKGLGGILLAFGLGAGTGYVYRDAITKKKEQAKWKVIEAVDRFEKGGKAGDTDLTSQEEAEIKTHLVGTGVKEKSVGKIIAMLNDVRSGKRYMGDTVADTDVSIGDIVESLKLGDYVPAEVMGKGGNAGVARDRKYTSQQEHELNYKNDRMSRVRYYQKGDE